MQGSAVVRLFHPITHECICDVNLAPAVNKMLSGKNKKKRTKKTIAMVLMGVEFTGGVADADGFEAP